MRRWQDLSQEELDAAYSQANHAPNMQDVLARYARSSELARMEMGRMVPIAYGGRQEEHLELFCCLGRGAPIHLFFHGGAWNQESARDYHFPAPLFLDAGAHFVVAEFSWTQDTPDGLSTLVQQVRSAVYQLYDAAPGFGADRDRIHISGHSSGAHLAAVCATTDWRQVGLPANVIKSTLCCSGIFDLAPVRQTLRNDYLQLTDDQVSELSPIHHVDGITAPITVVHGEQESAEFVRQSQTFAAAATAANKDVKTAVGAGLNHFEIMETMADPAGLLGRSALEAMGLQ